MHQVLTNNILVMYIDINNILVVVFWVMITPPFIWCISDLIDERNKTYRIIQTTLFFFAIMVAIQISINLIST